MGVSNVTILVSRTKSDLAEAAAARMVARIEENDGISAICLTGGSTPLALYRLLNTAPWRERIPWSRVHWFITDERFVPIEDPLSNMGNARRAFLDAYASPCNIHGINTDVESPAIAARMYEADLRSFHATRRAGAALFDFVLMGVGPDGHTASLFPNSAALAECAKWVVDVSSPNVAPFVRRVTLTSACLGSTSEMAYLVSGREKRSIIESVFSRADLPASRVRAAMGTTVWLMDKGAAPSGLSGKTDFTAYVVMGVSGSGKTTIGKELALRLGIVFLDGDDFHSRASIDKMGAGQALTEENRRPWLAAIADEIDVKAASGTSVVIACSALKRAYRDVLRHGRPDVKFIYLRVSRAILERRLETRDGHFMPAALLGSQIETLEEPSPPEQALIIDANETVNRTVDAIMDKLVAAPEESATGTP
jgi:6-phosphogluconolactonase